MNGNRFASIKISRIISRKIVVLTGAVIILLLTIDTLMTRQILPSDNNVAGAIMLGLTAVIGFGIGSWILFRFTKQSSSGLRKQSSLITATQTGTIITQFFLLAILLLILIEFYYHNNSTRFLSSLVFALSTVLACIIIGLISFKFFSWYKASGNNRLLIIYGLAAASIATAMAFDASAKLMLVQVVEEESPRDAITSDFFVYRFNETYNGDVQYKVVKPDSTTVYFVPSSIRTLYVYVNGWIPITVSFILTWAITCILLRQCYQRIGKLPIKLWIILLLPLILYMIGRGPELYSLSGNILRFDDLPNPFLWRVIFRVGVIGGSILFGIAFFIVSRRIAAGKLKDYLVIAAIGAAMIGISLSPSALQQTIGVAGRSLMLLGSFLFSFGFYFSAISIAHDMSVRRSISKMSFSSFLTSIGKAQLEQEIQNNVQRVAEKEQEILAVQTGLDMPSEDMKLYVADVLGELKKRKKE